MRRRGLQWLAGWLEGEGSFGLTNGYPSIAATSTDYDVVFQAAYLLNAVAPREQRPRPPARKQQWRLTLYGWRAEEAMLALYPLMSERRRMQIDRAIANQRPRKRTIKRGHVGLAEAGVVNNWPATPPPLREGGNVQALP